MKHSILNFESAKTEGDVELDELIFNSEVRTDIMARVVRWQLAKARSGNHKVKGRSEVKHTTRKPFKQKGTGRARQGMLGVAQMRGGGVVHGPLVRDHSHSLPKKVRQLGLRSAIVAKFKAGDLIIIDKLLDVSKTKEALNKLKALELSNALFVTAVDVNVNFKKATANIIGIDILPSMGLNVYDILKHNKLVFTLDSINSIVERL